MTEQQAAEMLAALKRIEGLLILVANNTAKDGRFVATHHSWPTHLKPGETVPFSTPAQSE